jgi:methionyl-tRNA formyltransferase
LRVVFAGTPPFAAHALQAILAAGHDVVLALTQPDRPAGRGMRVGQSAVGATAAAHSIPVFKPASLKADDALAPLREASPDVMVVAAYGVILPAAVLEIPRHGCLNIHASLLPRWRGAAPIQRALQAGDRETGICIMQMEAGLDTGPVLLEKRITIGPRDTAATLTDSLAHLGADTIVEALASLDLLEPRPQDPAHATYASKVTRKDAHIDWTRTSDEIDRQVRAFNPFPGTETRLDGELLKIWEADPVRATGKPGQVLEADGTRLVVACGTGALALTRVQRPGGKILTTGDFLRGERVAPGTLLESAPSAA